MQLNPLNETDLTCSLATSVPKCTVCIRQQFVRPQWWQVPQELRGLTIPEICVLSPLTVHQGDVEKNSCGYARCSKLTRSSWKKLTMKESTKALPQRERQKIMIAYECPMSTTESTFADFEKERKEITGSAMLFYAFFLRPTLECALFPDLFPFSFWCETFGHVGSHHSVKESLNAKISGAMIDYAADHRLHQFHFDRPRPPCAAQNCSFPHCVCFACEALETKRDHCKEFAGKS